MKKSGVRSIRINASYLVGANLVSHISRGLYLVLLARYLGADEYGLFVYGQYWYSVFLPLAIFGLDAIISIDVGKSRKLGTSILSNTLVIRLSSIFITSILCACIGVFIENNANIQMVLIIFSFALGGRGLALWADHVFVAYEASHYALKQQAIFRPLEALIGSLLLLLNAGLMEVVLLHAIIWWAQAARGIVVVHKKIESLELIWAWTVIKHILKRAFPVCLATLFAMWLLQGGVILARQVPDFESALGSLALVMQLLMLAASLPIAVANVALPILVRSSARGDGKDYWFAEVILRVSCLVGGSAVIFFEAFGAGLISFVFGDEYGVAGELISPAFLLLILSSAGTGLTKVLAGRGKFFSCSIAGLVGFLALVISFFWLIDTTEISGVLVSMGIGMGVWVVGLMWKLSMDGSLKIGRSVIVPLTAFFISHLMFEYLNQLLNSGIALLLVLCFFVCSFFFLGIVSRKEKMAIIGYLCKARGKIR